MTWAAVWSAGSAIIGSGAIWSSYQWARARARQGEPTPAGIEGWWGLGATVLTYLAVSAAGHLVWELAQLPLFEIWATGTVGQLAFATVHCTAGDLLIATSVLLAALVLARARNWPLERFAAVAAGSMAIGLGYTAYSEWHNVYVRGAWSYSAGMPTLSIAGYAIGLAPLTQWLLVPALALWAVRPARKTAGIP